MAGYVPRRFRPDFRRKAPHWVFFVASVPNAGVSATGIPTGSGVRRRSKRGANGAVRERHRRVELRQKLSGGSAARDQPENNGDNREHE